MTTHKETIGDDYYEVYENGAVFFALPGEISRCIMTRAGIVCASPSVHYDVVANAARLQKEWLANVADEQMNAPPTVELPGHHWFRDSHATGGWALIHNGDDDDPDATSWTIPDAETSALYQTLIDARKETDARKQADPKNCVGDVAEPVEPIRYAACQHCGNRCKRGEHKTGCVAHGETATIDEQSPVEPRTWTDELPIIYVSFFGHSQRVLHSSIDREQLSGWLERSGFSNDPQYQIHEYSPSRPASVENPNVTDRLKLADGMYRAAAKVTHYSPVSCWTAELSEALHAYRWSNFRGSYASR